MTAKYAIFLPVRNGVQYVREAIDSVLAQSRSDWILVVLDNASSDGTLALVNSYGHPGIQVHTSARSLPIWESWQRVWTALAHGDVTAPYATVIGHDDRLLPDFLQAVDRLVTKHPGAGLYQTAFDLIDADGRLIRPCRPIPEIESSRDFLAARLWGLRDSVGTGYVFRSGDYVAAGGIPDLPQLLYADDLLFARLMKHRPKATDRQTHCHYRLHRASASHRLSKARLEEQVTAIDDYLQALELEFPELSSDGSGRAALACFLAREVVLLNPLAREWLLSAQTCQRIKALVSKYHALSPGMDYKQWLGNNYISRDIYASAKQAMLLNVLLKEKLVHKS